MHEVMVAALAMMRDPNTKQAFEARGWEHDNSWCAVGCISKCAADAGIGKIEVEYDGSRSYTWDKPEQIDAWFDVYTDCPMRMSTIVTLNDADKMTLPRIADKIEEAYAHRAKLEAMGR